GNFEYLFDGIGNIFNGEVWTRAAFIATQQVTTGVPEPTTIALMLMGLFGIGLSRHKRVI
ncbi:MAG: PEP-CTERM sorting domain-containing protein, partial [Gammaproteobacteria bacterium]